MRGLREILRMNELEAAKAMLKRYERLRNRALKRGNFKLASKYDGYAQDFARFVAGEIKVWPGREQREQGLFVPSAGREFGST